MAASDFYWDRWPTHTGPFLHGGESYRGVVASWTAAAAIAAASGILFYGPAALVVLCTAVLTALAADLLCRFVRPDFTSIGHLDAALTGLLLGLTLPATVPWYVPATGAAAAILLGKALFGGIGHYRWHPALVGRVIVQFIFAPLLTFSVPAASGYVLAPTNLLWSDANKPVMIEPGHYQGWAETATLAMDADAIVIERPVRSLRRFVDGHVPRDGELIFTPLIRDVLPPWRDVVLGSVPGGIGETSTIALIVGGIFLIRRGHLRWQFVTTVLGVAVLSAAILPIKVVDDAGSGYRWFPALAVENGKAVGLAYVFYHLNCGQLMIAATLLGGAMLLTPLRTRGQVLFAAGVGFLTIFMRLYGLVEAEAYWAILGMNSLVPVIDRSMKRPVLGVPSPTTA